MGTGKFNAGGKTSDGADPIQGEVEILQVLMVISGSMGNMARCRLDLTISWPIIIFRMVSVGLFVVVRDQEP